MVSRSARTAMEDGDEEVGGFQKNPRTKPQKEERPWKQKTPRPKKAELAEIVALSATSAVNLPKKEEERMNRETPIKYCPTCLSDKAKVCGKKIEGLCDECAQVLIEETGTFIAQGKLVTTRDWMVNRLAMLEAKFASAKAAVDETEKENVQEAAAFIAGTIGNAEVSREARKVAFQTKKKELWFNKGGNAKYGEMMKLKERVDLLKGVLAKADNDAAEKAARDATANAQP